MQPRALLHARRPPRRGSRGPRGRRASGRRGATLVVLALFAWTGVIALALWRDPHAANDCAVLLAKSAFADGHVYVPGLFIRRWSDAAPGLAAACSRLERCCPRPSWPLSFGGAAARVGEAECSPPARAWASPVSCSLVALGLESWPSRRTVPAFPGEVPLDSTGTAFVSTAPCRSVTRRMAAETGEVDILVRSAEPRSDLAILVGGQGAFRVPGRPRPQALRPQGPLSRCRSKPRPWVRDDADRSETLRPGPLRVDGEVGLRFGDKMGTRRDEDSLIKTEWLKTAPARRVQGPHRLLRPGPGPGRGHGRVLPPGRPASSARTARARRRCSRRCSASSRPTAGRMTAFGLDPSRAAARGAAADRLHAGGGLPHARA